MRVEDQQLKNFLLDIGKVTKEKIAAAERKAKEQRKELAEVLLAEELVTGEELARLKAHILGIPFIDLEKQEVIQEVLRMIPEPIARRHNIVAYAKRPGVLEVAMLDPEDLQTIDFIRKKTGLRILTRLTTAEAIRTVLKQYSASLEAEFGQIIKEEVKTLEISAVSGAEAGEGISAEDLRKTAEDLPIVRIVDTLIKHAILQNASDIHVEPIEKEVLVRYRIDGILHDAMTLPKQVQEGIVARVKVLANLKLDEHRLPQDGRFLIETPDYRFSFRVSIIPVYSGEKIAMRLLPESSRGFTLEGLGFSGEGLEAIHRALRRTTGMILATGPTGSGKTTTLYTMMEIVNTPEVNIATVEDPIEYRMPRINQTQVRPDIGFSFGEGLRSLVRQDPDVIMVGEIRDRETASLAVNAALTGHLVLSTLHTNSAAGAIPRLIDLGIEPFLIASTVNVIIAQRLVRRLCEERAQYLLSEQEVAAMHVSLDPERLKKFFEEEKTVPPKTPFSEVPFWKAQPSKECPDGYRDRIGIHEVLEVSDAIRELTNRRASIDDIQDQALKGGMRTMLEDGFVKSAQAITSIEEVLRVISE